MEIFTATETDAEAIAALVNSGYRGDYSRQGWTSEVELLGGSRIDAHELKLVMQRELTMVLKGVEDGKIISCVELALHYNKLYLGMLTVEPTLQAKGIGKQMLTAADLYAREKGCKSIYMTVISERSELIAWYGRHGFLPTGEEKPFNNTNPVFGLPKKPLKFVVLEKPL
jgi:ribosomal protein S18 acetylase RimI-like enzyme